MNGLKSSPSRLGMITGLLLGVGIALMGYLLVRSQRLPASAAGEEPAPGDLAETAAAAPKRRADHPRAVEESATLTVDQLVAIFEKDGSLAALAAAKGLTGPDRDSQVLFILTYLARVDPEWVAGQLVTAGLSVTHQGFIVSAVMRYWTDGEKALAWADSQFTGDLRKDAVGQALRILVRTDSKAALAHLESIPPGNNRRQAMADLFSSWGGHDPKAALAYLEGNLAPDERAGVIEYVVGAWARNSPLDALAWVGTVLDKDLSSRLVFEVAMNWSSKSPEVAAAWVASLPDDPVKARILESIAERDRNTTICGPGPLRPPDQSWKDKAVADMEVQDLRNWGYQDPEGARKFLEHASGGQDLSELATTLAAGMTGKEGPAATFEWARNLPPEAGTDALRLAVISWSGTAPSAAAEKLESVPPELRAPLATALAENWSRNDPAAAAAWVAAYEGSGQKTLVREVLQQWAGSEPREAYQWLGSLPAGESRDEGISYLLRREAGKAGNDPESLVPWLDLITEPKLREEKKRELDGYLERAGK